MLNFMRLARGGETLLFFLVTQLTMVILFACGYWVLAHSRKCKSKQHNCIFSGLGPNSTLLDFSIIVYQHKQRLGLVILCQ